MNTINFREKIIDALGKSYIPNDKDLKNLPLGYHHQI